MMVKRRELNREQIEMVDVESLVPEKHLLTLIICKKVV